MRRELQVEPLILCLVQPAPSGTAPYKSRIEDEPDSRPVNSSRVHSRTVSGKPVPAPIKKHAPIDSPNNSSSVVVDNNEKSDPQAEAASGRTRRRRSAAV